MISAPNFSKGFSTLLTGRAFITLIFISLFVGCNDVHDNLQTYKGSIMGTTYRVSLARSNLNIEHSDILARLTHVNQEMSTYLPTSSLSQLNNLRVGSWLNISQGFLEVTKFAIDLCYLSEGAFDISVGQVVNAWGFGPIKVDTSPEDTFINKRIKEIGCDAIEINSDENKVRRTREVYIDLSALAKGYAIDVLANYLDSLKVDNYLIELGGELKAKGYKQGRKPWIVGIEHPDLRSKPIITLSSDKFAFFSLATSGNYRNFKKFNNETVTHTFDPRNGSTIVNNISSVSVISDSTLKSDALATTLNVMGLKKGLDFANLHGIQAIFISDRKDNFSIYPSNEVHTLLN